VLPPEPGALTLGVLTGAPAGDRLGLLQVDFGLQVTTGFVIADCAEQRQIVSMAPHQPFGFLQQAAPVKLHGAGLDALPQISRIESQFEHPPWRWHAALLIAQGPAGGVDHLQGTLGAHAVGGGDAQRSGWIAVAQKLVTGALAQVRQLLAQHRLGRHRRWRHPLGQGLEIKARAPRQQGQAAAPVFSLDGHCGELAELLQVDRVVGFAQIEQLMAHGLALGRRRFGRAHVHPPVELSRIDVEHGQVEGPGQGDGKGRLAAGGGPQQHDREGCGGSCRAHGVQFAEPQAREEIVGCIATPGDRRLESPPGGPLGLPNGLAGGKFVWTKEALASNAPCRV